MDENQLVSWQEILAILKRRRALVLNTFVVVAAAIAAGTFLMPKQYESRMKILVKMSAPTPSSPSHPAATRSQTGGVG